MIKNRLTSGKRTNIVSVVLLAFLILFLSSGKDFFHNHEPDFDRHEDCPVIVLSNIFETGVTLPIVFKFELRSDYFHFISNLPSLFRIYVSFINLRAPPKF